MTVEEKVVVGFACLCLLGVVLVPAYSCEKQAKMMQVPYSWGPFQGCMIEPKPGQWVPMKDYRVL